MKKNRHVLDKASATNLKVFLEDLGYSTDEYSEKAVLIFQKYLIDGEEKVGLVQKGTLADVFKRTKKDLLENLFIQINSGKKYWQERKRKYATKDGNTTWNERVEGRKKTDIIQYNAFMLDFDLKDEGNRHYKGEQLIQAKERLLKEIQAKLPLEPDYIVESRNGFHVYYLINPSERKMSSSEWHSIEIGIFDYVKANISKNVDHAVKKSNQIMRLPYSYHKKDDDTDDGYQVKIIHERKRKDKELYFENDLYESAMFAYPTNKIKKYFKIDYGKIENCIIKKGRTSNTVRQSKVSKSHEKLKSDDMIKDKYAVTKAITEGNLSYFEYLQAETPQGMISREEARKYIKSIDLRKILGMENQSLNTAFSSLFYEDKHPSDAFIKNKNGATIYYCRRENQWYYDIFDVVHHLLKFKEGFTEKETWSKTFEFVYKMFGIHFVKRKEENIAEFKRTRMDNIMLLSKVVKYSKRTKYLSGFVKRLYEELMELWKEHSEKYNLPWRKVHMTLSTDYLAERLGKKKRDSTISKGLLILETIGLIKKHDGKYYKNNNLKAANEYQFSILMEGDLTDIIKKVEKIREVYKKPMNEVTRKGLKELRLGKK